MARASRQPDEDGVRFVHEDDGSVTAVDQETGVASFGDTKAEALRMLAEALELHECGGDPVTDEDLEAWQVDPEEVRNGSTERPEFMK